MRQISEAEYERILDARVQRALKADSAYVNAENSEEQAAAEEAITDRIVEQMDLEYEVEN